jgi:hypothetical protein
MVYQIKQYTLDRAAELGLIIHLSDNPKYKIEVYDGTTGLFLFYGGDSAYADYPTYLETHSKTFADTRRKLYHARHAKEINDVGSRGSVIAYLLW